MNLSPLPGAVLFASPPQIKGEGDVATTPPPLDEAKPEKLTGASSSPQSDKAKDGDFAAVLAAARPQGAAPTTGKTSGAQVKQPGDEALSTMIADTNALIAKVQKESGKTDFGDMVASFVGILQNFDDATGGNTVAALMANLTQLDTSGLARLDAAAGDPAALLAALASLAGLPVTESGGMMVSLPKAPQAFWPKAETAILPPVMAPAEQPEEGLLQPLSALPSAEAEVAIKTPPLSGPADSRVDVRATVLTALAASGSGVEVDGVPVSAPPSEARAIASSAPDVSRPADVWQPPASGFARNLVQQIRTAKVVDGHTRISLAPRGLGEIEIDMRPDEAGKLRIILRAENPAVLHALRGDRDGLLLTLSESGADIRDADLSFEDFSHRHRREAEPADVKPGPSAERDLVETAEVAITPVRARATGSLDMLT